MSAERSGLARSPPSCPVSRFLTHIPAAILEGEALLLPDGISWSGMREESNKLYIRPHYKRLYDLVVKDKATQFAMLTGTTGVGNSYGAYYYLYRAVRDLANDAAWWSDVIYVPQLGDVSAIFRKDGSVDILPDGKAALYASATSLLLSDSRSLPPRTDAYVRIFGSPDSQLDDLFNGRSILVHKYVLPPCSLEELEALRKLRFRKEVSAEQLKRNLDVWGGSARMTLAFHADEDQEILQHDLYGFLASSGPGSLEDALTTERGTFHDSLIKQLAAMPHRALHILVATEGSNAYSLLKSRVRWASDTMRDSWIRYGRDESARRALAERFCDMISGKKRPRDDDNGASLAGSGAGAGADAGAAGSVAQAGGQGTVGAKTLE